MEEIDELKELYRQRRISRREFLRQALLMGVSASTLPTLLAACGGTQGPGEESGTSAPVAQAATDTPAPAPTESGPRILRYRLTMDVQDMDPAFRISAQDTAVMDCVYDGLFTYGPNSYEVIPALAESFEQSEDGLEISFKLREGVQWHKGYGEVTTEDVKFSYERFRDEELAAAYADDWLTLDRVEIIDKYNGKIILKEPFAPLWTTTLPVESGQIICKKYVEEVGREKLATAPLGCGPYIFEEWVPKQRVIVKRNPDYWGEQPYFDEIHFIPIDDDKAGEIALEAGEVDFGPIGMDAAERFEANPAFKVVKLPSLAYQWIGMCVQNPKLEDINVRQAVRYGIDVNQIIEAAYFGQVEPAYELIAPGLLGYWADAPRYQRDVAKAKEYLAKAGLESLDLTLTVGTTTDDKTWAEVIQQNLAEVGINVTINALDTAAYNEAGFGEKGRQLELFRNWYSMNPDPGWATMWFTCEQVEVWNWMFWCNEEFDKLHYEALKTLDEAKRNEMYIRMQQLWDEACHTVWVTHGAEIRAMAPDLEASLTPHGRGQARWFKRV